jgi:hypothetical protein
MESGDGKHDKQSGTRFDAMRRHKVDRTGGAICSSLIDDQFPTPIRLPFLMKIGDDRDPALRRSTALYEPPLMRVVMSQEAVPGGIRIVIEPHMTPDDIRERLDMVSNAGEL